MLVEAERRVDAGDLRYDDTITIEDEDITADGTFEVAGTELTLDEALELMITISDNGAALALWRVFGPESINATLRDAGMEDHHAQHAVADAANAVPFAHRWRGAESLAAPLPMAGP